MIVLDEQLNQPGLAEKIARWYPGRVAILTSLRAASNVKDDAVDTLLRTVSQPTFVTINVSDFWKVVRVDARFSVVCVDLPVSRSELVSNWLREFLSTQPFNTKAGRMGVIALIRPTQIEFYRLDRKIQIIKRTP